MSTCGRLQFDAYVAARSDNVRDLLSRLLGARDTKKPLVFVVDVGTKPRTSDTRNIINVEGSEPLDFDYYMGLDGNRAALESESESSSSSLEEAKQSLRTALRARCNKVDKCVRKCPPRKPSCPFSCQQVFDSLNLCPPPPPPPDPCKKPMCGKTMPPAWRLFFDLDTSRRIQEMVSIKQGGIPAILAILFVNFIISTKASQSRRSNYYDRESDKNPVLLYLDNSGASNALLSHKYDRDVGEFDLRGKSSASLINLLSLLTQSAIKNVVNNQLKDSNKNYRDRTQTSNYHRYENNRDRDDDDKYNRNRYRDNVIEDRNNRQRGRYQRGKDRFRLYRSRKPLRSDDRAQESRDDDRREREQRDSDRRDRDQQDNDRKDREQDDSERRDRDREQDERDRRNRAQDERDRRDREQDEREKRDQEQDERDRRDRIREERDGRDQEDDRSSYQDRRGKPIIKKGSAQAQIPVIKSILRSLSCNARDECEDSCSSIMSRPAKNACEDECEVKFECPQEQEDDSCESCTTPKSCTIGGSTKGITLETAPPSCKRC
ncbi:unnamed protein product [Diatraea saccharalis]|uniref:Uncharacterized protein n=1 Tax=Diatraea saccharalis TaxID=40085 RepID=A0A9N9WES7_9NEOP|nr:unnamed protein product [Diatraea saccharalis]